MEKHTHTYMSIHTRKDLIIKKKCNMCTFDVVSVDKTIKNTCTISAEATLTDRIPPPTPFPPRQIRHVQTLHFFYLLTPWRLM